PRRTSSSSPLLAYLQRLDDADVAHRAATERLERLLVGGACIGSRGLLNAREFRDDDALFLPGLVGGGGGAAREIAPAERRDRRRRKLRISGKLLRIGDRPIDGDPVRFRHRRLRVGIAHRSKYQPFDSVSQLFWVYGRDSRPPASPTAARATAGASRRRRPRASAPPRGREPAFPNTRDP